MLAGLLSLQSLQQRRQLLLLHLLDPKACLSNRPNQRGADQAHQVVAPWPIFSSAGPHKAQQQQQPQHRPRLLQQNLQRRSRHHIRSSSCRAQSSSASRYAYMTSMPSLCTGWCTSLRTLLACDTHQLCLMSIGGAQHNAIMFGNMEQRAQNGWRL